MNKTEYESFTASVDAALGHLRMTWEGPEPHDFRNMEERGVRFVHSDLFAKILRDTDDFAYAPAGTVEFIVLAGDRASAEQIEDRIRAAGYAPSRQLRENAPFVTVSFSVPILSQLSQ